jgi:hypothetical protein
VLSARLSYIRVPFYFFSTYTYIGRLVNFPLLPFPLLVYRYPAAALSALYSISHFLFPRIAVAQQIQICSPLFRTPSLLCLGMQGTTQATRAVHLCCRALFKTRINSSQINFPFLPSGIDSSRFTLRIVAGFILCLWSPVNFFGDNRRQFGTSLCEPSSSENPASKFTEVKQLWFLSLLVCYYLYLSLGMLAL